MEDDLSSPEEPHRPLRLPVTVARVGGWGSGEVGGEGVEGVGEAPILPSAVTLARQKGSRSLLGTTNSAELGLTVRL